MIVNARRALERVLYERFLSSISSQTPVTQQTLFPVQVQVGTTNKMVFESESETLRSLGFDITPFGNDTIVVGGVPEGYSCEQSKVEAMVYNLLLVISEGTTSVKETLDQTKAQRLAILGASTAGPISSPIEAQNLLTSLLACEAPEFTPTGHRIISILSSDELDKKLQ